MKKIIILLAFIASIPLTTNATHMKGGEITWRCLGNGQYQFYMDVYRECGGTTFSFTQQTLRVQGAAGVSSIAMLPDINRRAVMYNGNVSPVGFGGCQKACDPSAEPGVTEFYPFKSDPVTLSGVPPANGWTFYWSLCCRPSTENLQGQAMYYLRAKMYPFQGRNANPCYDSSPRFQEMPAVLICKGYDFVFNHNASDVDLDSLVYRWADPLQGLSSPVQWKNGYSASSPTPGPNTPGSSNPNNKPATLDAQTGEITFGIYSTGQWPEYTTCVQVDAYRCGVKIASVFRDLPFILFNCPKLPSTLTNYPPKAMINGIPAQGFADTVYAGEKISIPFQSTDNDITYSDPNDPTTARPQKNTLSPSGFMFSQDFTNSTNCAIPGISPCATLTPAPQLNQATGRYELTNSGGIASLFEWQTDCKHISLATGCTSTGGRYNFVMKTFDDHCDVPGLTYPSISIRILAPPTADHPEIRGVSVELDGTVTMHYKKPPKPNETLDKYELQYGTSSLPVTPSLFLPMDQNIRNYRGPYNTSTQNYKVTMLDTNHFAWPQDPAMYTFFRMRSYSGCDKEQKSDWSDVVRVPRADFQHIGPAGAPNSRTKITWDLIRNPAGNQLPSASKTYKVWANYPVKKHADLLDPNNWNLIATTKNQEHIIENALTCSERVAIRVEMMDSLRTDSVISYFTSITSFIMAPEVTPPSPIIDSVSVDINGDVYIGITPGRPALKHDIFDVTNGTPGVLIGTIYGTKLDTLLGINGAANNGSRKFRVEAFDECEIGLSGFSDNHHTIYINPNTSYLVDTCAGNMLLNWNPYVGWPTTNNNVNYDVMFSTTGPAGPYTSAGSSNNTTFTHSGVLGETDYWYKILASDDQGHRSTSAIHFVNHGKKPSSDVVDAPVLLCTRVMDNGRVELEWETPEDPSNNRKHYAFEYNENGTWRAITPVVTDTALTIKDFGGFNANNGSVKFRVRTFSDSCGIATPSPYSDVIESIYLDAVYQVGASGDTIYNAGEVHWNSVPLDSTQMYELESRFEDFNVNNFQLMTSTSNINFIDPGNAYCDTNVQYRAKIQHPNGCYSISNIDEINYLDNNDPNMQPIDYVSYDYTTGELVVRWSMKPQDSPDVDSVALVVPDPTDPTQFDVIKKVDWNDLELRSLDPLTDASMESKTVALQVIDECGRDSKVFDLHSTIDIDAGWDTCAQTVSLNWNPYETFRSSGDVEYTVYFSEDGDTYQQFGDPTKDTLMTSAIANFIEAQYYYFYVIAKDGSGNYTSFSNLDSIITLVENVPDYTYLRTATVNAPNQVQVDGFVDDAVAVTRYHIFRGLETNSLSRIGSVLPTDVTNQNLSYMDNTASTDELSYYYKIQVESPCGNFIDTSNLGRTIHLEVTANNERVANVLEWNHYVGWDTAAAFYNIYRGVDGAFDFITPHATVYPEDLNSELKFVDDVSDEAYAMGQFCYTIEAVEGAVKPELASYITSATSKSNYACADAEPLFYIPNAFSPTGYNKVFRPEGQFVNFAFYEMIIYNRWGAKVFETREFFEGWDGTINGEQAQDGTYVYTIRFKGADGREHSKKGTVTLIN